MLPGGCTNPGGGAAGGAGGGMAGGPADGGCWGGGAGDLSGSLGGLASGAMNSLASAAFGQLLAANDKDPAALAIGKFLASQYGKQALEALKDPAAFQKKLKQLFEGAESKAEVKLAWGTVPSTVVLNKGQFGLRRTDPSPITEPPDFGEVVEGNDAVLIGDLPAAGKGFIVIGKRGTVGELDHFSPDVLMGGGASIEIPPGLVEDTDDQTDSSDDSGSSGDQPSAEADAQAQSASGGEPAAQDQSREDSDSGEPDPGSDSSDVGSADEPSAQQADQQAGSESEGGAQGDQPASSIDSDEPAGSAGRKPPSEITERREQISREMSQLAEAREYAEAMHERGEPTDAELAQVDAEAHARGDALWNELEDIDHQYPTDEDGNLVPPATEDEAALPPADDAEGEETDWGDVALELGKDVIGISDLEDAYEAYEKGEYWSAAASLAMVLPWAKVLKLLKIFAKLIKAGKSLGKAGKAGKDALQRLAVKFGDETGAIGDDISDLVRRNARKRRVSPERRKHILDGDGAGKKGGGHRHGTGKPNKSEFPADWDDNKVIDAIEDVANDPNSVRVPASGNREIVRGTRDGVDIEVVVEGSDRGGGIVTGYPTNTPRNPK